MKTRSFFVLAFFCLSVQFGWAQGRLTITGLANYPVAGQDTAYDIQSYDSILISISNTGNQVVAGGVDVLLQGNPGVTDTLFTDTAATTQLSPGDTVTVRPTSYQFDLTHYDDGDNIVVVWPAARTTGVLQDTLTIHVYFVRLSGIDEPYVRTLVAYPNPVVQYIRLETGPENVVKYVRILDSKGVLIYHSTAYQGFLDVTNLSPGLYIVELGQKNGKSLFARIIKE
ncbi:MAG TPA: T9SS type A sorting domain-containing protein [Bacteroidia bacterium]|nr:T9SS type A sorting domain-containing protein [Bacteroidia bacterium]